MSLVHEIGFWGDEILAAQTKMASLFYFQTARAYRINSILKIMSKFMFSKMTRLRPIGKLVSSFFPVNVGNIKYTIRNRSLKFEERFFEYTL